MLIPGTTQLTANDIHQRLLRSHATCVITDNSTAEKVDLVLWGEGCVVVCGSTMRFMEITVICHTFSLYGIFCMHFKYNT